MMSKIKVEESHTPYSETKKKILLMIKPKLIKLIKNKKVSGRFESALRKNLINEMKIEENTGYKLALHFILLYASDFQEIEKQAKIGKLNTDIMSDELYWKNPSKKIMIFFTYTFLYELYEEYLNPHLDYLSKKSLSEIFAEINSY